MSTKLPGDNPTAYLGLKETNPPQLYFRDRAPTVNDYRIYDMGDIWINRVAMDAYILVLKIANVATWIPMGAVAAAETLTGNIGGAVGPDVLQNINVLGAGGITITGNPGINTLTVAPSGGGSLIESITGDTGGAVGPDGVGNINFLGDSIGFQNGIHFTGTPLNNTLTAIDLRNITVYVVDAVAGQTEYQTVQDGIDAANAAGGGTVYIRPGTYTEDLVLYDQVDLIAAVASPAAGQTTIIGTHVPPNAGSFSIRNLTLQDTTNILNSAAGGTTTIALVDCILIIDDGISINLPNWTGLIGVLNCHCLGTEDGFIDIGAGAANFLCLGSTIGAGALNMGAVGGTSRINDTHIESNLDSVGQAAITNIRSCQWINTLFFSDDAMGTISNSICIQDVATAINHTSSSIVSISNTTITSSGNPDVITGTGTVQLGSVIFNISASINAGITQQGSPFQITGPIEVIPEDASVAASDAWVNFNIPSAQEYSWGIDNTDDFLKITDGVDPSTGNLMWSMTPAGERTMPLQPAFLALVPANDLNVTGAGAVYVVGTNVNYTEVFDQNADFNIIGVFTAPVTGRYLLTTMGRFEDITAAMVTGDSFIVTSNRTYYHDWNPANYRDGLNQCGWVNVCLADMDAADTAHVTVTITNGAGNTADLTGHPTAAVTYFCGRLSV